MTTADSIRLRTATALVGLLATCLVPVAGADDIVRRANPTFPIATSVTVPAGTTMVFVSGTLADVVDDKAPAGSVERLGDTATQAQSVLDKIARELQSAGFAMTDVVRMNVYLVGDPRKGGAMDFDGFMRAYLRVYGPQAGRNLLPARTTVQVAALPLPGALVEIEVVAAKREAH